MNIKKDRELVDALCEIDHGLSEWEVEFVEGIARQVHDEKKGLSPKQRRISEEIFEEHCR